MGAASLALAGALQMLPMEANFDALTWFDWTVPWFVPLAVVGVLATAFAYVAGIAAITRLGPRLASFVGLFEVVLAWLLLGEALGWLQIVGGALILAGVVCIRLERTATPRPEALLEVDPHD